MTRYLIEILIAATALTVAIVLSPTGATIGAGAAGVFLGFGLFRYVLAGKLYRTVFNVAVQNQVKHGSVNG